MQKKESSNDDKNLYKDKARQYVTAKTTLNRNLQKKKLFTAVFLKSCCLNTKIKLNSKRKT